MTCELLIGMVYEINLGLVAVLFMYLSGGTEKNHKNLQSH
jgi:hypothetical protein